MKRLLILFPMFALAACSAQDADRPRSLTPSVANAQNAIGPAATPPVLSYVALSGDARAAAAASERRYGDGFVQTVPLGGDSADNVAELSVRTSAATLDEPIPLLRPSEASIQSQLSTQFPKTEMKVVTTPRSNALGRYGLAVGTASDGKRCAYFWQWTDDPTKLQSLPGALELSLRIRMCTTTKTLDQLAAEIAAVRIGAVKGVAVTTQKSQQASSGIDKSQPQEAAASITASSKNVKSPRAQPAVLAPSPIATAVTPRYIVPLVATADTTPSRQAVPSSYQKWAVAGTNSSSAPATYAGSPGTDSRIDLPPEAYNPGRKTGNSVTAQMTASDSSIVTGTRR